MLKFDMSRWVVLFLLHPQAVVFAAKKLIRRLIWPKILFVVSK